MTCKARGQSKGYGSSGTPENCVFPFTNDGKRYSGCIPNSQGAWCATKVDSKGKMQIWARCNNYCRKDNGEYKLYIFIYLFHHPTTIFTYITGPYPYVICKARGEGNGYGTSGSPQNCKFPFTHNGKRYNGCATTDKNGSWCATKVDTKGNMEKWARCNNYCKKDCGKFIFLLLYTTGSQNFTQVPFTHFYFMQALKIFHAMCEIISTTIFKIYV